jgi:hypothetical protein
VALRAIDSDSDERLEAVELSEDGDEHFVENPVDLDMKLDLEDDSGKEGSA